MSALTIPYSGVGITLGYKAGSSTVFTSLALLKDDCEFSGFEVTPIDIKTLASNVVTKTPGRQDSGTFTGSCYLVNSDTGIAELFTLFSARSIVMFQVQLPDGSSGTTGSTYVFSGFLTSIKPGTFTGEDAPTLDFEIAISGLVTVSPGT